MKKTLRYKTYWLGVFGLFLGLGNPVLGAPISEDRLPQAKNYYVDALSGDDSHSGLSAQQAWKSLKRASQATLAPGDSLLLRRGTWHRGQLEIKNVSGNKNAGIVIGAYGQGQRLIIHGDGASYAVAVKNAEYITVRDLELTNKGVERMARRGGLLIEARDCGVMHGIHIDSLFIHDVNGSLCKECGNGAGIYINNGGEKVKSAFCDLLIENCHLLRTERNGMIWNSDYYDRRKWFPSMNTVVRYNLLEEIPGDGIVPIGCDGVLIEYNLMRRSTPLLTPPESAAGLWAWSCDNIVIQYNEVSDMKAPWDGQGFDADWNSLNTTIRYNYSHDNEGGFLLLCDAGDQREYSLGNRDIRVNYNLSIGDGTRTAEVRGKKLSPLICMFGNTSNTIIDHNVFHINSRLITEGDPSFVGAGNWYGEADSTAYIKNVFYSSESSGFKMGASTRNYFEDNWYLGQTEPSTLDASARRKSEGYDAVLHEDPTGFIPLLRLTKPRKVCGAEMRVVDPEAMKAFFERL